MNRARSRAAVSAAVLACALAHSAAAAEPPEETPAEPTRTELELEPAPAEPAPATEPDRSMFAGVCPKWDLDAPEDARRAAAQTTMERAETLFKEGRSEEALATIDVAECHWPDRDYDYMRGVIFQSERDCVSAVVAFQRFLSADPPEVDARAARAQILACRPPPPADLPPPRHVPDPPERHWSRDPAGASLLGVGIGLLVAGTGLAIAARVEANDTAPTFGAFEAQSRRIQTYRHTAIGLLVTSAVCLTGAAIRYAIVARRNRDATRLPEAARRHSVLGRMSFGPSSGAK